MYSTFPTVYRGMGRSAVHIDRAVLATLSSGAEPE